MQPADPLLFLKADAADLPKAPVHIVAHADSRTVKQDGVVARAASCPAPLPADMPASAQPLQQALRKPPQAPSHIIWIPSGKPPVAAPEQARPADDEGCPSSPSSTGSTRYIKPLTPAQSGECYRNPPPSLSGAALPACWQSSSLVLYIFQHLLQYSVARAGMFELRHETHV